MPVYEYQCQKCGKRHEVMQKFSDPLLTTCPVCKGKLKKLISNTSFVLKGTGWYVTDYARKDNGGNGGNGHRKKTEKAPEEKAESKAETADKKPEAKPEAKKDSKPEKKASSA